MQVQETTKELAKLYHLITGLDLPTQTEPMHPIPPERDAEEYVSERLAALVEAASALTNPSLQYAIRYGWVPRANSAETPDAIRIDVELPGVRKEDITIEVREGLLAVSGRRVPASGGTARSLEIPPGRFARELPLPDGLDLEGCHAVLQDGLLSVQLPKGRNGAAAQRRISIEG